MSKVCFGSLMVKAVAGEGVVENNCHRVCRFIVFDILLGKT
ncbi:MAG: hypothetical protein QXV01_11285 [Candidatus Bathyarchaeia archaeon]